MSWLDGLLVGFSQLRSQGVAVAFQKAINFSQSFLLTNNTATGATDVSIDSPTTEVPISDDRAGTVSIGDGNPEGLAVGFKVPNGDSTADALFVDNDLHQVATPYAVVCKGIEIQPNGRIFLHEIPIGSVGTPSSGFFIFADDADHKLKAKGSSATVTTLANP